MISKKHLFEKFDNCKDLVRFDQNEEKSYSLWEKHIRDGA